MIRQSFIDERISDLHHHTLHSTGDSDGEMSKATSRRLPAPVGSRIIVKKNSSLLPIGNETTTTTANPSSSTSSSAQTPTVDPRSRIELLERNLRYVQQQHEITLTDLHNEITKLQHENRDLHFRMVNIRVPSSSSGKQRNTEVLPNIHQLANLTQNEPVLAKRLQEVQRVHFEQQIDELRIQLIEAEQKNEYLTRTIDELSKTRSQPSASGMSLLILDSNASSDEKIMIKSQMTDAEYQNLLQVSYEKQREQVHEIKRLRAVLREILHAERLSSTSKVLIRDCLASTIITENSTTASMDSLHTTGNQQSSLSIGLSTVAEKNSTRRPSIGQRRLSEQRMILPPIVPSGNILSVHDTPGANNLSNNNQAHMNSQQQFFKFGETPVARRGRRTQELQRTRLTRNHYH